LDQTESGVNKNVAMMVAALAAFVTPFMGSSVTIALPSIGREFSMDAVLLGWVATSYSLTAAIFLLPFGKLGDIHGRKRVFTYGLAVFTAASLLSALASSALMLIAIRVVQAIGGAMIFGTGTAILTSVFPPGERGRALGINVAATYAGLSLGPVLGGWLTQSFGWRSIFLANVPLGLAAVAFVRWQLKGEWAEARGEAFDLAGSIIYGASLAAVMYGLSQLPGLAGAALILGGTAGIGAFVWWETRTRCPILNMSLFRDNTVFALSNLAALINYSATAALGFLLSLYLQYIKALSPQEAGVVMVSQPVIQAIFSPLAGRFSDRVEPRLVASAGMALAAAGLGLLATLDGQTGLPFIMFSLVLLGLGFALFSAPNTNAVMSAVDRRFYGVAAATLGTMRLTGQMLSMGVAMLIFALFIGKVQITPEYYPLFVTSVKTAFTIFAVLCSAGVLASLARGKVR
jgi:EmrB/QacA subfamily drug resistance transporter